MGIINKHFITLSRAILVLTILSGCIADPGVSKKRGRVVDFSQNPTGLGCGTGYLMWSQLDSCAINACPAKTHLANTTELAAIKQYITDVINNVHAPQAPNGQAPAGGTVDQSLLDKVNTSAGVCLNDVPPPRPTNQVFINSDFCSCINGKPDIINDCASTCANYPVTSTPTLYLNTTVGPDIQLNQTLQNLQGWCSNPLPNDTTPPQCTLSAWDGVNTIDNINVSVRGNSLTADLTQLSTNKTYVVKIVESKSGSKAQSVEFQIRRVPATTPSTGQQGAFKVAPISQYTCISYGGSIDQTTNQMKRDKYIRKYYYFAANETPPPRPPLLDGAAATTVCHDEVRYPGNDSAFYPRLELLPQHLHMWDKADQRFADDRDNNNKPIINKILRERLINEYSYSTATQLDLFTLIRWYNRPPDTSGTATTAYPLGLMMVPFTDPLSGKTMCPSRTDFLTTTDPLFMLLREYIYSTEALYLAEKEPEILPTVNSTGSTGSSTGSTGSSTGSTTGTRTEYGVMLVTEGILKKYGFYIENGLKIKADQNALETKMIYYYWPVNSSMDPLQQGDRKLFTVRYYDTLQGGQPNTLTARTSDKRIGCVPPTPVP